MAPKQKKRENGENTERKWEAKIKRGKGGRDGGLAAILHR